jgi:hypothetical protein
MAIIKTIVSESGFIFKDQYCRIEEATVFEKTTMRYTLGIYVSKEAITEPPHRAEIFQADFDLFSELNLWQQAYVDIKNRWTDAVDA